jgi:DNA-3-methyladenine glycosylase I
MSYAEKKQKRCWDTEDPLIIAYHDKEWGTPLHQDRKIFEFLLLESFQAGLSWNTILRKRENFRRAFDGFDFNKIALYGQPKIDELLQDAGIVRNRLKILAAIGNAQAFLKIRKEFGTFDRYIWGFVGYRQIDSRLESFEQMPARTPLSDEIAADLKKRGFKFMGSTVVYAHMQAAGMVNDHLISCFRHKEIKGLAGKKALP